MVKIPDNIDSFILDVFNTIKNNYYDICESEDLNMMDNFNWDELFDENNITVHYNDWFPHELVWKVLENKIKNIKKQYLNVFNE